MSISALFIRHCSHEVKINTWRDSPNNRNSLKQSSSCWNELGLCFRVGIPSNDVVSQPRSRIPALVEHSETSSPPPGASHSRGLRDQAERFQIWACGRGLTYSGVSVSVLACGFKRRELARSCDASFSQIGNVLQIYWPKLLLRSNKLNQMMGWIKLQHCALTQSVRNSPF